MRTLRTLAWALLATLSFAWTLALAAPAAAQDARAEARTHFARGVELFDEARYDAALAEFQRAYQLAPAAQVLYNIAQIHAALGHAVEAADTFERYLRESGDAISTDRRAEVVGELDRQRARIARLVVEADVLGAIVSIDDVDVGPSPLPEAIRVSAGEHVVAARAPGHETVRHRVRISGGTADTLRLELLPSGAPHASLRLVSGMPGVEIVIDERSVGLTPFDATVPVAPGPHRLRAHRTGYLPLERAIEVAAGAELRVDLALERDAAAQWSDLGTLEMHLPHAPFALTIDGARVDAASRVQLPQGPHAIGVEVAGRRPWTGRVELAGSDPQRLRPELEWTPEAYEQHHRESDLLFTGAGIAIGVGAALVAAAIPLYVWNQGEWSVSGREADIVLGPCAMGVVTPDCEAALAMVGENDLDVWLEGHNRERSTRFALDATAVTGIALGSAVLLTGVVLAIVTPDHAAVDRAASARLDVHVGPGGAGVAGTF